MKQLPEKYIIVEIIPTALTKEKGDIIELTALKLSGLKLEERFNYRLNELKIPLQDFIKLISYDKHLFTYKESTDEILDEFEKWSENLPLLIIDNAYTKNFLSDLTNDKKSIFQYFDKEYHDQIIEELIKEYQIEPTNYIVDVLYECLIKKM